MKLARRAHDEPLVEPARRASFIA